MFQTKLKHFKLQNTKNESKREEHIATEYAEDAGVDKKAEFYRIVYYQIEPAGFHHFPIDRQPHSDGLFLVNRR